MDEQKHRGDAAALDGGGSGGDDGRLWRIDARGEEDVFDWLENRHPRPPSARTWVSSALRAACSFAVHLRT